MGQPWLRYSSDDDTHMAHTVCILRKTVNQVITTGTLTKINWDVETFDPNNMHDNSTNNERITPPDKGIYLINCQGYWESLSTFGRRLELLENGSVVAVADKLAHNQAGDTLTYIAYNTSIGTDYYEIRAWQNTGVNRNFRFAISNFSLCKIAEI